MSDVEWKAVVREFKSATRDHAEALWLARLLVEVREKQSNDGGTDGSGLLRIFTLNLAARMAGKIRIGWELRRFQSPIEERMMHMLTRSIVNEASIDQQRSVVTDAGIKRPDFLLVSEKGKRIVIECDGKQWHDQAKDSVRDSAILRSGNVDRIIRFRGCDIWHREVDLVWLLCEVAPEIFSIGKRIHFRICADTDTGRIARIEKLHGYTVITVDRCVGVDRDEKRPFTPGCQVMFMDKNSANETKEAGQNQNGHNPIFRRGHTSNLLVPPGCLDCEGLGFEEHEDEVE